MFESTINPIELDSNQGFSIDIPISDGKSRTAFGDFNGDGIGDLAFANSSAKVTILYGSSELNITSSTPDQNSLNLENTNNAVINLQGDPQFGNIIITNIKDINNDDKDDLFVSVQLINGAYASRVVFGGFEGEITLTNSDFATGTQNDSNGFVVNRGGGGFAFDVQEPTDANNDGINDLVISEVAGAEVPALTNVVFGTSEPFGAEVIVNSATQDGRGFSIDGDPGTLQSIGDFNGDSIGDYAMSSGIVFGRENGITPTENAPELGFLNIDSIGGITGSGDFNGDGINDVVISERLISGNDRPGRVSVVFGGTDLPDSIDLNNFDGTNGFTILGKEGVTFSEIELADFGNDFNSDGLADLAFSETDLNIGFGGNDPSVDSYVVLGRNDGLAQINLNNLNGTNGFVVEGSLSILGSPGDFNGDGFDDIVVGTPGLFSDRDSSDGDEQYIVLGRPTDSADSGNNPSLEEREVYRFFNNDTGVHFYTSNEAERDAVLELPNYSFEGASYESVNPLTGNPEPSPVYRFLNQDTGVHLYTISEVEKDATQKLNNFSFEGEAFFAYENEVDSSIPIYRFFNTTSGAHFYTPSATERDSVEANLPDFQSEGIAYYALPIDE